MHRECIVRRHLLPFSRLVTANARLLAQLSEHFVYKPAAWLCTRNPGLPWAAAYPDVITGASHTEKGQPRRVALPAILTKNGLFEVNRAGLSSGYLM